jgi:hypothetical protein
MRKHVPPEDEGAESVHGAMAVVIVYAFGTTALPEHGLEALRADIPAE